jgi:twitching motility two-component system response regulator PilH
VARIIVIEDEPDQVKLIRLRLEARGHQVFTAVKAKEGIELAARECPDLILLDMILPDMHGLDALIKLKQNRETRRIPVIAISAIGSPDFTKACLQEGVVAYIRKPYNPRELFKIIEKSIPSGQAPKTTQPQRDAATERIYRDELSEIERPFTPKPLAPHPPARTASKPHGEENIDEMIKGALADLPVSVGKKPSPKASPPLPAAAPGPGPKSILIIDDDTSFGRLVSAHLAGHGYEISLALDGVSGLKRAFQSKPDLVLLNLILPAGGGEIVLENLRKSPESCGIPVFIMSSLLSPKKLEEKARELGAQGFISKPIEPEDLLYIIESVIGS